MSTHDVIVIGTSAGGVDALQAIARGLPGDLPAAVLVVMHQSPQGPYLLPAILRKAGPLEVAETVDGASIERGKIYVAPPDHHLLVKGDCISLVRGPKENRSRPAIDPLFRTAAAAYGPRVVGVILTGMLDDGTAGLSAVKERGGIAVVQDPEDARYPSMPKSALRYVGSDFTLPLLEIAPLLARLVREPMKTPAPLPVSRLIEIESRFVEMEAMKMQDMEEIGSHAGVSCPECHGPIWKIKDGTLQRYRCHVGHAYTAQAMAEGQIEAQEIHLWQALRLMKERVSLIWEMRSHAESDHRNDDVAFFEAKVRQLQKNIDRLQAMIEEGDPLSGTREEEATG
jgi:two-component system, chemotaxis family, protein-glutamate methylesterase/glutaminase